VRASVVSTSAPNDHQYHQIPKDKELPQIHAYLLRKPIQTLYESGNKGSYATLNLITFSWNMWHPLFSDQLFLTSRRRFFITFTIKSYMRGETRITYKFYALYPQITAFSERIFYLCVENVMRVLDPFFLHIKSWCRKTLHEFDFRCRISHKTFCTQNQIEILR